LSSTPLYEGATMSIIISVDSPGAKDLTSVIYDILFEVL
jgi:hypothetical protein